MGPDEAKQTSNALNNGKNNESRTTSFEKARLGDNMDDILHASEVLLDDGKISLSTHKSHASLSNSTSEEEEQLEIVVAAGNGDLDRIKELVEKLPRTERPLILNASAKRTDFERCIPGLNLPRIYHGATPLIEASMKGHEQTVEWLLLQGADPTLEGSPIPGVFVSPLDAAKGGRTDLEINYFGILERAPEIDKNDPRLDKILRFEGIPGDDALDIADILITKKEEFALCIKLLETALIYWKPCNYSSSMYTNARVESNFSNAPSDMKLLVAAIRECHVDPFFHLDADELAGKVQILMDIKDGKIASVTKRHPKVKLPLTKHASPETASPVRKNDVSKGETKFGKSSNHEANHSNESTISKPSRGENPPEAKAIASSEPDQSSHSQSERRRNRTIAPYEADLSSHSSQSEQGKSKTPLPVETRSKTPLPVEIRSKTPFPVETRSKTPLPVETRSKTPLPVEIRSKTPLPSERRSRSPIPSERCRTPVTSEPVPPSPSGRRKNRLSIPIVPESPSGRRKNRIPIPLEPESPSGRTKSRMSIPLEQDLLSPSGRRKNTVLIPLELQQGSHERRTNGLSSRLDVDQSSYSERRKKRTSIPLELEPSQAGSRMGRSINSETEPSHSQSEQRMSKRSITPDLEQSHSHSQSEHRRTRGGKKRSQAARQSNPKSNGTDNQHSPRQRSKSRHRTGREDRRELSEKQHSLRKVKGSKAEEISQPNSAVLNKYVGAESENERRQELSNVPKSMRSSNSSLGRGRKATRQPESTSQDEQQRDSTVSWRNRQWKTVRRSLSWSRTKIREDKDKRKAENAI